MGPIDGIVFDIDGCVARGSRVLPGVPETLAALRARGIRCAFLSNENMSTRAQVVEKLNGMGIPASADDVVTSSIIAAEVTRTLHPGAKVLAIGVAGVIEALQSRGVALVDREHAAEAEVVVMGKDPDFDMKTLELVCRAIWNGAEFIATNGKEPLVTGKPSKWAGEMAMKAVGVPPERGAVVGDQLEQDIAMGKQAGLFTILVLTGVTTAEQAAAAPEALRPDLVLPDVNHLPAWLDGRR
ncbi:MAG: HAD hydrolase-like protein [Chloroflexi bacterium]|nr:HAD hydrolase-like protein [Chloroflexota bacterium]